MGTALIIREVHDLIGFIYSELNELDLDNIPSEIAKYVCCSTI